MKPAPPVISTRVPLKCSPWICRQFIAVCALSVVSCPLSRQQAHADVPAAATTYYVSPSGNDGNAGNSDAAAFATLQRAANAVKAGDTVIVRAGTYTAGFVMGWDSKPSGTEAAPIKFLADAGAIITG